MLGTSGLIEAYKSAAIDALSKATIVEKAESRSFLIKFEYSNMNELMKLIRDEKASVLTKDFSESGSMEISIRLKKAEIFESKLQSIKGISILD